MSPQQSIETFFKQFPRRSYQKGDVIIQAGSTPAAYYIIEGLVTQYDIAETGDKLIVNIYKPGAFVSLASILNSTPSDFFFEAAAPTTIYIAPPHRVVDFLRETPGVALDALARISHGSNGLMLRLARIMEGDAEGRIIQELKILHARFASETGEIRITKAALASQTGLARETVSRALTRLAEKNIIRTGRGIIEFI